MKKYRRKIIKWLILIICLLLFVSYIYKYNKTYNYGDEIIRSFDGIKYQAGNMESSTPVKIEIKGTYKKQREAGDYLLKGDYMFEGDIIVDGEPSHERIFLFNDYNMTSIENDSFYGMIFISHMMEEITIEILELDERGGHSFSYDDGWFISAPSSSRDEAAAISNKLKMRKDYIIK